MNRVLWGCLLLLSFPTRLAAQEDSARKELRTEVTRLVRALDAAETEEREKAEAALVEMGVAALEFFPSLSPRTPAEVKVRLERVRTILENSLASSAAEPSRVTLQGELALAEALRALEEQTGNRIVGFQQRSGRVTVDFQETLFWKALDELLDQAELRINAYGGETSALVLEARPSEERVRGDRATYQGVFRFEPIRLEARRDLRNPAIDGLRLTMEVTWEPRIRPISLRLPLNRIEVLDERGQRLTVDTQRETLTASADAGISAVEITIPLELPARKSGRIKQLKGVLNAVVPGGRAGFEFSDLASARDVEQRNAGVTVIYERMRRNQDLYEIRVRVRFDDAGEALQSHRGWVFSNEAFVRDAGGRRIDNVGLQTTRQEPTEVGIAYLFPLPKETEGFTFVYETPANILRLPIEFELSDIQLP